MKREINIYGYERKLAAQLRSIENSDLSKKNKRIILEFKDFLVRDNLSVPRILKYMEILKTTSLWMGKDFDKITKKDAEKFVSKIQGNTSYSPWIKQT